ncbi:MAG: hypothetical protein HGA44_21310 [Cellulomonadaceae bacterium]|nr:hypothetical protein [Cellulomonadaceae bacterium]
METTQTTAQSYEDRLRQLQDGRMAAGRALAAAAAARAEAKAAFDEAEAQYATTYAAAVSSGWSEGELRRAGLEPSGYRAPRSTTRRTRPTPPAAEAAEQLG